MPWKGLGADSVHLLFWIQVLTKKPNIPIIFKVAALKPLPRFYQAQVQQLLGMPFKFA